MCFRINGMKIFGNSGKGLDFFFKIVKSDERLCQNYI